MTCQISKVINMKCKQSRTYLLNFVYFNTTDIRGSVTVVGVRPVHCRILCSIPGLYLLGSSTYSSCANQNIPRIYQMSCAGQNHPWLRSIDADVCFQPTDSQNANPRDKLILSIGGPRVKWVRRQTNTKLTLRKITYYISGPFPSIILVNS